MKLLYISNFYHHMWKSMSEELDRLTDGQYRFIETAELSEDRIKLGFQNDRPSYVIQYNESTKNEIDQMIMDADAVIIGASALSIISRRIKKKELTFRYSERLYKTRSRYLKYPVHLYRNIKTKGCYLLCSGAFVAKDFIRTGGFKGRCYKWGYFPEVKKYESTAALMNNKNSIKNGVVSIVWAARLIPLKHPEMAIEAARRLRDAGYKFELNIIGIGPLQQKTALLVKSNNLEEFVHLRGAMPPSEVRKYMEEGDIFLMTSNRQEGWGAVINEAMNSGCAVVASHSVGSVPFLINHEKNGLCFKSENMDDLYIKVKLLMDNPEMRKQYGMNAYETMVKNWSGSTIAKNLLTLVDELQHGLKPSIMEGPCSPATIIKENWIEY